ncbi:hypothetical protein VSVS05_01255 [Vibrio scophthalmi]|uniref:Uncharacterized protein n=1 Tax=Vibrio scophthalmi TaxID=45658 RepID=A0A1C7F8X1_9VIBR|nr:hypothetical protein VSVS05_01255 [Vibrio scophthalmi]
MKLRSLSVIFSCVALAPMAHSAEESPNDFDKNHKFKVDAHLVM